MKQKHLLQANIIRQSPIIKYFLLTVFAFNNIVSSSAPVVDPPNVLFLEKKSTSKIEVTENIQFVQASYNIELQQGTSQGISEYISTSDNVPVSATLRSTDGNGVVPTWLSVNNQRLNGIAYTSGSEITFVVDAANMAIGSYTANVSAASSGYVSGSIIINISVIAANLSTSTLKVNFQDSATITPTGWLRDFGQHYAGRNSPQQGRGNKYGWFKTNKVNALDLRLNGRRRNTPSDVLLSTLMHMQGDAIPTFTGTKVEGIWQAEFKNGVYDVTVSVGDGTQTDSRHTVNVEGVNVINNFIPSSTQRFFKTTTTLSLADNLLTVDANGGVNTKINWITLVPSLTRRPSVVEVTPQNKATNISINSSISTSILKLPNGGINNNTIKSSTVYLKEEATGIVIPANVNGTGGGDAITLVPTASLKNNTVYRFTITPGVKDLSNFSFVPYSTTFKTGSDTPVNLLNVAFQKIPLANTSGQHSSVTIGPDGKLYAITIDGIIKRFVINTDGTLGVPQLIYALQDASGIRQKRLSVGLVFDPASTPTNLVAWVSHSSFVFTAGPDWDGKISKLSGANLQNVQDVLINLPRSKKDHLTNSIGFGPDGNLYFTQGSNSGMGRADNTWGLRSEHLLSAALLKLTPSLLQGVALPLDVKTSEGGGSYSPYAINAPLKIYASGIRNGYDLLWHSNGQLYVPANGSAAGGNTPASVPGALRMNGSTYSGPEIPELSNVQQTLKDYLFRIQAGKYYGHPNTLRGEYVLNGGNPTSFADSAQVDAYPVGTLPDANYMGFAFDFHNNKSPDGVIEYKSSAFNNALKGKILVVRYSQNDDIIVLTPGGTNKDIISYTEGTNIQGFSGFADPLDLVENKSNGNIYVSEYGGNGQIVLLKPAVTQSVTTELLSVADAQVRSGIYSANNFGTDTFMMVKGAFNADYKRSSYIKFNLPPLNVITSAKFRFYGRNVENTSAVNISAFGVNSDFWLENSITANNVPVAGTAALGSVAVTGQYKYYDIDVTAFVKLEAGGDKTVSLLLKDVSSQNIGVSVNTKEAKANPPKLIIQSNENTSLMQKASIIITDTFQYRFNSDISSLNTSIQSVEKGYTFAECDAPESPSLAAVVNSQAILNPIADAFVRNGTFGSQNFGADISLMVKATTSTGYARNSYLKFNLASISKVSTAKLRIYGNNTIDNITNNISIYPLDNDTWTETGITWNNAPTTSASALAVFGVNNTRKYYEIDVTSYVNSQFSGDKIVSFLLKDPANTNKFIVFNSKENTANRPELIIESNATGNALLFVENTDKFPSNDDFVFSHIQIPWGRDSVKNHNHDSLKVRIHNKGISPLVISNLILSKDTLWKLEKLNGVTYSSSLLPLTIASGTYADLMVKFIENSETGRVRVFHETLTIVSNDDVTPSKVVNLHGLWQKKGEGVNEPYAQEMINTFGFKTLTGYGRTDPDKGNPLIPKGDEILPKYFVRVDATKPVYVIQMGAYHGCCITTERIMWHAKGSTTTSTIFTHIKQDGQTLLGRRSLSGSRAEGNFNPTGAFGFKTGSVDWSDYTLNPGGLLGIRVWKAKDPNGNIIPNSFIIANDYLGSTSTNYDYNDNMYFVSNLRPEIGTAYYSELSSTPSAMEFGEKLTQSTTTVSLPLKSLGQTYSNGTQDPAIIISSLKITGSNSSEFTLGTLSSATLNPQQTVTLPVSFKPTSQGLKIADLLVYYNNSTSPLRVPLYGIAKTSGTTVTLHQRINSGGPAITANGKTWKIDQFAKDNLEPYRNPALTKISSSDDDAVILDEQSSNADKKPFRYAIKVNPGNYSIRLHFAELYWGAPGTGLTGGPGSRVMSVTVEGILKLINLDVAKEVGIASELVKNIPVTVSDDSLNINFSATVNRPMVCAIEVYSFSNGVQSLVADEDIVLNTAVIKKPVVYPNPVYKTLNIQFPETYKGYFQVELIDAVGQTYKLNSFNRAAGSASTSIDISRLALKPGIYLLRIKSDGGSNDIIKVVIQ